MRSSFIHNVSKDGYNYKCETHAKCGAFILSTSGIGQTESEATDEATEKMVKLIGVVSMLTSQGTQPN